MLDVFCVGHASYDITMAVPSHPKADEKIVADAMQLAGGGPAANAAVCVARLGGAAAFCGYLGNDVFGQAHVQELISEGVDISSLKRGDLSTPISQILAKADGCRSVVNYKETDMIAALDLHTLAALLEQSKLMLFDGHEGQISVPLCDWAKEHGMITVLDAGSLHQGTADLMMMVDYVLASEKFARQWCEKNAVLDGSAQSALQALSAHCDHVVITLGSDGLIWQRDGERGAMKSFDVDVLDSTGAGDAFHGAFALGLARDMDWLDLLRFASAAGALTCTRLGARCGLPDAAAVDCLLGLHDA
ncbi:MAG: PfkB family carbohydrate kinase [Mariprofundus sp.]|nr:PfkB family carbohydrate kinase [Mariprofundus sp.]